MKLWMVLAIATMTMPAAAGAQTKPDDPATQKLIQTKCAACHPLTQIAPARKTNDDWGATIDKMIGFGAQISDAEYDHIVDYLSRKQGVSGK
jgi:cytochrome c5